MLDKKSNEYDYSSSEKHLLRGLVFCKNCKARIIYNKNHGKYFRCVCSTYKKYGNKFCSNIHLREDFLIQTVILSMQKEINKLLEYEKLEYMLNQKIDNKKIEFLESEIREKNKIIKTLYEDKVKKVIAEDLFVKLYGQYEEEKEKMKIELEKEILNNTNIIKKEDLIESMKELILLKNNNIDRNLILKLIDKIEIDDRNIEIYYKFKAK